MKPQQYTNIKQKQNLNKIVTVNKFSNQTIITGAG